jgi:hypothetical protein
MQVAMLLESLREERESKQRRDAEVAVLTAAFDKANREVGLLSLNQAVLADCDALQCMANIPDLIIERILLEELVFKGGGGVLEVVTNEAICWTSLCCALIGMRVKTHPPPFPGGVEKGGFTGAALNKIQIVSLIMPGNISLVANSIDLQCRRYSRLYSFSTRKVFCSDLVCGNPYLHD